MHLAQAARTGGTELLLLSAVRGAGLAATSPLFPAPLRNIHPDLRVIVFEIEGIGA
jgi:hypothetical protein